MPMRRLSDALSGPCFGVPIAFSEATQLQAYSCNDGSVAVEYPGLSRVVKDVFILDPIGLGIAGGTCTYSLSALAGRERRRP